MPCLCFFDIFHFICGQNNCYITVSQPVVNRVTNDLQYWWQTLILPHTITQEKLDTFCFTCYDVKGMKPPYEVREGFPKILQLQIGDIPHFVEFWQLLVQYYLLQMVVGLNNGNYKHTSVPALSCRFMIYMPINCYVSYVFFSYSYMSTCMHVQSTLAMLAVY